MWEVGSENYRVRKSGKYGVGKLDTRNTVNIREREEKSEEY